MNAPGLLELPVPVDLDAEGGVLGALMYNSERHALMLPAGLTPDSFFSEAHRRVFQVCQGLMAQGQRVTRYSVEAEMRATKSLAMLQGGADYLEHLENSVPAMQDSDFSKVCGMVLDRAARREAIKRLKTAAIRLADPRGGSTGLECIAELERELARVALHAQDQRAMTPMKDVLHSVFTKWQEIAKGSTAERGVSSGFPAYDAMTGGGLHAGDLVIVAARPGMGKTAFAMSVAANAASSDAWVGVFSLEMPAEQLAERMLASAASVSLMKAKSQGLSPVDWTNLMTSASTLARMNIHVDDCTRGRPSVQDICVKARRLASEAARNGSRLRLIVVDYIQIVRLNPALQKQRHDLAIGEVSMELKSLAKELGCTVIGVAQLNRDVDSRNDKRPLMSDLRDSGQLEQDADLVLMLYRERYYKPEGKGPDVVELLFQKNRHGPPGKQQLEFMSRSVSFRSLDMPEGDE